MDDAEKEKGHQVSGRVQPSCVLQDFNALLRMLDDETFELLEVGAREKTTLQHWCKMLKNSDVVLDTADAVSEVLFMESAYGAVLQEEDVRKGLCFFIHSLEYEGQVFFPI